MSSFEISSGISADIHDVTNVKTHSPANTSLCVSTDRFLLFFLSLLYAARSAKSREPGQLAD